MKFIPIVNHSLKYNPSLDGLRGIAISLVLLFHIWPEYFSFGYVGVDIFFVLSGFLITQIIYTNLENNRFSTKEFYRNRIRRVFPAMIITVFITLLIGYLFMFPSEFSNLGKHIKSSVFFYENIRLMNEVGYWDKEAQLKPLLHFWSLSIEEQFYLIWPFIVGLIYKFRLNLTKSFLGLFLIFLIIPSFFELNHFYNSFSRFYELIFGGFIFSLTRYSIFLENINRFKYIIYIFFIVSISLAFNNISYNVFINCSIISSTGFLLLNLINDQTQRFFSSKILVFLGLISFPLYLIHYVFIAYMHIFNLDVTKYGLIVAFISIIFSFLIYRFVELYSRKQKSFKFAYVLFVMAILFGLMGQYVFANKGLSNRSHLSKDGLLEQQFMKMEHQNQKGINLVKNILGFIPSNDYIASTNDDLNKKYVLIVGDSHAHTSYTGFAHELKKHNIETLVLANSGCAPYVSNFDSERCKERVLDIHKLLDKIEKIDNFEKVIFVTRANSNSNMEKLFEMYKDRKKKLYFLVENPPLNFSPDMCMKRPFNLLDTQIECKFKYEDYKSKFGVYLNYLHNESKKYKNTAILDATNVFCDNESCYGIRDGIVLYTDTNHHSVNGSRLQAESVINDLLAK